MKKLGLVVCLLIMFVLISSNTKAQSKLNQSIDDIFPDANLANEIALVLSKDRSDIVSETELNSISILDVNSKNISNLEGIGTLSNLTSLKAASNDISVIPLELYELDKLYYLQLTDNEISVIEPEIGNLIKLEYLYISNNKLSILPDEITSLVKLSDLIISNNEIEKLPNDIGNLVRLTRINAIHNKLEALPDSITLLTNLDQFNISENDISVLPDNIGDLISLDRFYLTNNQLTSLPSSILDMDQLVNLNVGGNLLGNDVKSILEAGLPSTIVTYSKQDNILINDGASYTINNIDDFNDINLFDVTGLNSLRPLASNHNLIISNSVNEDLEVVDIADNFNGDDVIKDDVVYVKVRALGSGIYNNNSANALSSNTLKLIFVRTSFDVKFISNGSEYLVSPILYNDKVNLPTQPTKNNYSFVGWYTDDTYTTEFDFNEPITSNTSIYAKFDINKYQVITNVEGVTTSTTVDHGSVFSRPDNPTKTNYTFMGWYTDVLFTNIYDFNEPITGNIRIYAKFNINQYQVITDVDGITTSTTVDHGSVFSRPDNPTKTNHTFIGWYTDTTISNEFVFDDPITSNTIIYAKFNINQYQVITDVDGITTSTTVDHGSVFSRPDNPTKTNHTFMGWYTDTTYNNEYDFSSQITSLTNIYALFKLNQYQVNIDLNGSIISNLVDHGSTFSKPIEPIKPNHTFTGWYTDATYTTEFDFNEPITSNTSIYAKFDINKYQVTFIDGDKTNIVDVEHGAKVKQISNEIKDGLTFKGWYLNDKLFDFNTPIEGNITLKTVYTNNINITKTGKDANMVMVLSLILIGGTGLVYRRSIR